MRAWTRKGMFRPLMEVSGSLCSTKVGAPARTVAQGDRECRLLMIDMNRWGRRRPRFRYLNGSIIAACLEHLSNGAEGQERQMGLDRGLPAKLANSWQMPFSAKVR